MGVRYVEYLVNKPETPKTAMLSAFGAILLPPAAALTLAFMLTLLLGV